MDTIKKLRRQARAHRDEKIRIARQECARTLADLDRIALRMDVPLKTRWSLPAEGQSSTNYALAILAERGPLTVLEITIEARPVATGPVRSTGGYLMRSGPPCSTTRPGSSGLGRSGRWREN
jgi:hypothetical protein